MVATAVQQQQQQQRRVVVVGIGTTLARLLLFLSIGNINLNTINRNAFGNLPCDFKIDLRIYKP